MRRAVWHPFAGVGDDRLSGLHVVRASFVSHAQRALEYDVNSSNSGVWPGSTQPPGLSMCAMLSRDSPVFTRPMYSSMIFGLLPAAVMRVGVEISVGIAMRPYGISISIAIVNRASSFS